jgi:hypothetical protein
VRGLLLASARAPSREQPAGALGAGVIDAYGALVAADAAPNDQAPVSARPALSMQ